MFLRYKYFSDGIDHEAALADLSADKIKYINKKELSTLAGQANTETIWEFNTIFKELPLVVKKDGSTEFETTFLFTQDEYDQIKEENPFFAGILYSFKDRLAVDEDGNLYDIPDDQPKSFQWYSFSVEC